MRGTRSATNDVAAMKLSLKERLYHRRSDHSESASGFKLDVFAGSRCVRSADDGHSDRNRGDLRIHRRLQRHRARAGVGAVHAGFHINYKDPAEAEVSFSARSESWE